MKSKFHLLSLLLFLACVGTRFVAMLAGDNLPLTIAYYVTLCCGLIILAIDSFGDYDYANVFVFENNFHLGTFAYLTSVGFFVAFFGSLVDIYNSVMNETFKELTSFVPLCASCLFAMLSSVYFVMIAKSYGKSGYDFRQLRLFNIVPLAWSASNIFGVLNQAISVFQDITSVLKYVVFAFSAITFYRIAIEVDNTDGAKHTTVFSMRGFYFSGILYFINELMLLLSKNNSFSISDGLLSVAILAICGYMYFCEKNIISHTKIEV